MSRAGHMFAVVLGMLCIAVSARAAQTTKWADGPASRPANHGPDTVVLRELVKKYEPVPFDHKSHAQMAAMWGGCETCHHRTPQVTAGPATRPNATPQQVNSARVPACKSCHLAEGAGNDLRMPNLKGAYHRQCLDCHREWMHENACQACHRERTAGKGDQHVPTKDDIVGRMHPPIREPEQVVYRARYEPAVGRSVTFRHKEHIERFGLSCVTCHHRDACANCHDGSTPTTTAVSPIHSGRTWSETHEPCVTCHQADRCVHCHYSEGGVAPVAFEHKSTGQMLDKDHADLACRQCHAEPKSKIGMSCGGAACHAKNPAIAFPAQRPGAFAAIPPTTRPATRAVVR